MNARVRQHLDSLCLIIGFAHADLQSCGHITQQSNEVCECALVSVEDSHDESHAFPA